jgi:hypothetical protein
MRRNTVCRGLGALIHAIVAQNLCDPQPIVLEHAGTAFALSYAVLCQVPPVLHGLFVPEELDRQHLARIGERLEPLNRDEAVDLLEEGAQFCGDIQILIAPPVGRPDFEDDCDHDRLPSR